MTWQKLYVACPPILACCDGDVVFQEDPMKPQLDEMTDRVVASLSGEAKEFYDREFGFFHEVTSISGKLKPYIKKEKSEKKVTVYPPCLRLGC